MCLQRTRCKSQASISFNHSRYSLRRTRPFSVGTSRVVRGTEKTGGCGCPPYRARQLENSQPFTASETRRMSQTTWYRDLDDVCTLVEKGWCLYDHYSPSIPGSASQKVLAEHGVCILTLDVLVLHDCSVLKNLPNTFEQLSKHI